MVSKKGKKKETQQEEIYHYEIKPTWKEIFEDWIRFFAAYAITVTILIILIKYF